MSVTTTLAIKDASAAISNVASIILAAAPYGERSFLFLANPDATITIWVNLTGTTAVAAAQGCIQMLAGTYLMFDSFVPNQAISVIADSGTPNFTCQYA